MTIPGEVYRARDSKLERDVAIKVLPEEFLRDKERLNRFEREAKLLAQLNHTNVATLYGLEESGGRQFLAMELVEGETLAERIARGPIPVDEAVPLFIQIAEGVEAAHEKNIIHRDLKPANIKIGPDGKPKILDFGLAKAFVGDDESAPESSQSPTLTKGTALGAIMGTAAYMSPEQARGKPVDKRTDIWAFGCCLYEALTRRKPFDGDNVTDVLAAVVRAEPDWDPLPRGARALVKRCLNKDPRERLRDIGDGRIELARVRDVPRVESIRASQRSSRPIALGLIALLVGLATGLLLRSNASPPDVRVRRLDVRMPVARMQDVPVLSPDGSMIVFRSGNRLYSRRLDEAEAEPISGAVSPGPADRNPPFFSPDGQWLGFFITGEIYKVSIHGGPAIHVVATGMAGSATWGGDGHIYFSSTGGHGISRVSAEGGEPEALTEPESGTGTHIHPEVLPNASAILYVVLGPDNQPSHIESFSLATGESKLLVREATMPRFSPTGHLVFEQNGNLVAAPFDPKRLELTGPQVTLVEGIARLDRFYGYVSAFSFSNTGELVYRRGTAGARRDVVWVDRDGNEYPTGIGSGDYVTPTLSPDGRLLCLNEGGQLWVHDFESQTRVRVTDVGVSFQGVWTPDGKRLIFSSIRDGRLNLHWQPVDGSGSAEALTASEFVQYPNNVTSDGRLSFYHNEGSGGLWTLDLETMAPESFLDTPQYTETYGKLSPDGKWMAYASNETDQFEIYVRPFPGPDPRHAVSIEGGTQPQWSRDGRELFYLGADRTVMAVEVETAPELRISNRRELFSGRYHFPGAIDYDVAPDGRFIMLKDIADAAHPAELVLVEGWFQELARLVPAETTN